MADLGTVTSAFDDTDGVSSLTIPSVTVSGESRYLLVGVGINNDDNQTISNVSYGGMALTRLDESVAVIEDDGRVELWGLVDPPVGTASVTVTSSAPLRRSGSHPTALSAGAWPLSGVDAADPVRDVVAAGVEAATVPLSLDTADGDLVLTLAFFEQGAHLGYAITLPAGATTDWDDEVYDSAWGAHLVATGSSTDATWSSNAADKWVAAAVAIRSAAPAGPQPPSADFTASPTYGPAPLTVRFTSTSTGDDLTGYVWDFGDGPVNAEDLPELNKTYAEPGTYTVTLTVTSEHGTDTETKTGLIVVTDPGDVEPPPVTEALPPSGPVQADRETQIFPSGSGDIADDPAIWYNPTNPAQSVVLGSRKDSGGGIYVYDLDGSQRDFLPLGECNNVDLRETLGGILVVTSNRTSNTLSFAWLDPATRTLSAAGNVSVGFEPYGCCLYVSPVTGDTYAFVSENADNGGDLDQYQLSVSGATVSATKVRDMTTSTLAEGMVAHDAAGHLFVGVEDEGLYRYSAEPDGGASRVTIDTTSGHLTEDVEGLTIAYGAGASYLIATSQGDSTFQVYDLDPPHAWRKEFWITSSGSVDAVTDTDGVDVMWRPMGPLYPHGLIVAHDNSNSGASVSNFKYASLGPVLGAIKPTTPWHLWDGTDLIPLTFAGIADGAGGITPGTLEVAP